MTRNELTKLWAKVTGKFNALIGGAPEALDTLKEIADKLGDDDDALAGLLTQVGSKQDALVSGQNIKSINGQSVLGSGNLELGELFVVRMTRNNSNSVYTADKSVSEIYEASYTNGKPVIAVMRDISNPVLILTDCNPDGDSYVFSAIESNTVTTLRWQRTDDYTYELETIVLQPHLVSGTNIKTLNNESLLGSGNVTIAGKSAYQSYVDTTTDNPPKTEAEWVASLKGEDGVSLGEVAIADDLDTDDARKVLSARQGYNLGQKVNDVDAEPIAGSEKFVKSGGVQNELALGAVYDVSAKNPTAGINNDGKWESLSTLLSDANLNNLIPTSVRKGGMSIKFVQSSDNKYVQYRLTAQSFTTNVTQWQGVDEKPVAGSNNLVESGGVYQEINEKINNVDLENEDVEVHCDVSKKIYLRVDKNGILHAPFGFGRKTKILFIGNSLCQNNVTYLPWLLKNTYPELDFTIGLAYIGGYTINDYMNHVVNGNKTIEIYSKSKNSISWVNFGTSEEFANIPLLTILRDEDWDIIVTEGYYRINYVEGRMEDVTQFAPFVEYLRNHVKPNNTLMFGYLVHQNYTNNMSDLIGYADAMSAKTPTELFFPSGVMTQKLTQIVGQSNMTSDGLHNRQGFPCIIGSYPIMYQLAKLLSLPTNRLINNDLIIDSTIESEINPPKTYGDLYVSESRYYKYAQKVAIQSCKWMDAKLCSFNLDIFNF